MKHAKTLTLTLLAVLLVSVPMAGFAQGQSVFHRRDKAQIVRDADEKVQELIAEKVAKGEERTQEAKVKACEKRQTSLEARASKYKDNAGKYLGVVDKIFDRVVSFHDEGKLTAPNYEDLLATAEAAQSEAKDAVDTLGEFNTEFDCENPDVVNHVVAFKDGAGQTRQLLHTYSASVKDLISAMQSANSNANRDGTAPVNEQSDGENETTEPTEPVEPVETEKDSGSSTPDVPPPSDQEGL